jgi:TolB-like protein/Tfp pilus assembly protein PilF
VEAQSVEEAAPQDVKPSIAVLPLANLSADPSQEYFADGMTEELIATLGQIPGLNVISRTSAMRFKGSKVPLPEIARALRVDAVLEGAVFAASGSSAGAAPTNVRITARLIEAGSDTQLWNRTFEAGLSDVLQLQRQIAGAVSDAVNVQRGAQSAAPAATRTDAATQDPIVFDLYLRGRYYWNTRTEEGLKRSIQYFQEAIDRDPKFARAYVGLADAYTFLAVYGRADREDAASRANAAAATALAMDDSLAEAHASLALIAEQRFDWDEAQRRFSRAIALKPGYAAAHHWYADYLSKRGQIRDAIAEIQTALSLDPLSTSVNAELGALQIFARDYDAAIAQLEKTSRMDPGFAKTHLALAEVYGYKRDFTRAFSEAAKAEVKPGDAVSQGTYAFVLAAAGRRAEAIRIREDLALRYAARDEDAATVAAILSVALGEHDQAFTWLERARERKEPWIAYFAVDPRFDAIRPDARSAKLLAALGLAR